MAVNGRSGVACKLCREQRIRFGEENLTSIRLQNAAMVLHFDDIGEVRRGDQAAWLGW